MKRFPLHRIGGNASLPGHIPGNRPFLGNRVATSRGKRSLAAKQGSMNEGYGQLE
jgi:hypothetical protein